MATWRLEAGPALRPPVSQLTGARSRKMVFSLTAPSTLGFAVDARTDQALDLVELATDAHATRDGRMLYSGRLVATADDFDDATHTVTASCTDAKGLLARRLFAHDVTISGDPARLWSQLLATGQSFPNADLGIFVPNPPATGATVYREIKAGASIRGELDAIAGGTEGGSSVFDWDITPGWTGRTARFWAPQRGRDLTGSLVLDYTHRRGPDGLVAPRSSPIAKLTRSFDPATYANVVQVTGGVNTITTSYQVTDPDTGESKTESYSHDVPTRPIGSRDDLTVADVGTWAAVEAYPDIKIQSELQAKSDQRSAELRSFTPTYTLTLRDGWWQGPDHIWLGDTVRLIVNSGRVQDDVALRVSEIGVDLDDDGAETITLTLGPTRRTELSTLLAHTRRLALLERTR